MSMHQEGGPDGSLPVSEAPPQASVAAHGTDRASGPGDCDTEGVLVRPDQLTFTVVTAGNRQPLGKRFWLNGNGELQTETAVPLASGEVAVEHAASISAFVQRLDRLEAHQAVLYGIPSTPTSRVVTQERLDAIPATERKGVIARTREHLQFTQAPGCMMLDFDVSGAPQALLDAVASPERVRDLLVKAVPELVSAPM